MQMVRSRQSKQVAVWRLFQENMKTNHSEKEEKGGELVINRDAFRSWVSENLAPVTFLLAYFLTVVVGNLFFLSSSWRVSLQSASYTAAILQFDTLFSAGFWALLFAPFLVTPVVVKTVRLTMSRRVCRIAAWIPEFQRFDYAVVTAACLLYVYLSLWRADAFALFARGADAVSSVEARFLILGQMSFVAKVVLMSLLSYLSIYPLVRWMRTGEMFWAVAMVFNVVIVSVFLTVINMKWPILIFYAGLILSVFVYAKKRVYLKVAIGSVFLISAYLLISTYVFRLSPVNPASITIPPKAESAISAAEGGKASQGVAQIQGSRDIPSGATDLARSLTDESGKRSQDYQPAALKMVETAFEKAPWLISTAVNRMAVIYPYYYQVFTNEGAVCGGVVEQARIGQVCRPSTYIYKRMFQNDRFSGIGTSPASVHVSGYALGGWPVALFALVAASVILGLFSCLPLDESSSVGALGVVGAIAGYHFSQLPGEGPLIYDHGIAWTILALALYAGLRVLGAIVAKRLNYREAAKRVTDDVRGN
ncbi:hypothetical protein GPA27_10045 [Aromatoleum toluolicum]|uniref:Transmembrane protein n=1 Tax=Aromatoleum toluolicum TaxID=90060 RepID=A0ABX1NEM7_9RHOO|nr:hypothetical protein [Aromatoleum toluolicum]NMF97727.1 hypothetical protein [Aromatoleum toluolicum]